MRHLLAAAAAGLLISACAPTPAPEAPETFGPHDTPAAAAECAERGGEMKRVGRLGWRQCIVPYADAGKRCTDGDQCLGDCHAAADLPPPPPGDARPGQTPALPTASEGRCQADSSPFGCHTRIENGQGATICVD